MQTRALRRLSVALLLSLVMSWRSAAGENDSSSDYRRQQTEDRQQSWIGAQLHRFRTFRHLDRAQRLLDDDRKNEAQEELEIYLRSNPDDKAARGSYLRLLYDQKHYDTLINYVDAATMGSDDKGDALLYRGLAKRALGQTPAALADFQAAAGSKGIDPSDRLFAWNMVADLASDQHDDATALAALDKVLAEDPAFTVQFRRGLAFHGLKREQDAQQAFAEALRLAKDDRAKGRLHRTMAELAVADGRWQAAREAYRNLEGFDAELKADVARQFTHKAYGQGNTTEAIHWARTALIHQDDVEVRRFLANLLIEVGDHQGAVDELEKVRSAAQSDASVDTLMALGYQRFALHQYARAASAFGEAAALQESPDTLNALFQAQQSSGQTVQARATLARLAKFSATPEVLQKQAFLAAQTGHRREAVRLLEQTVDDKNTPLAVRISSYRRLGELYRQQKLLDKSAAAYEKLATLTQDTGETDSILGDVYAQAGLSRRAADHYRRCVARNNNVNCLLGLAMTAQAAGRSSEAMASWKRLLKQRRIKSAQRAEAHRSLGYLYAEGARNREAEQHFAAALKLPGDHAALESSLGVIKSKQHRWGQALLHFERALAATPGAKTRLQVARTHAALKHVEEATKYYEQVLRHANELRREDRQQAYSELSTLYELRGNPASTAVNAQHALDLGYDPVVALRLGDAQRQLGNTLHARAILMRIPASTLSPSQEAMRKAALSQVDAKAGNHADSSKLSALALQTNSAHVREYYLGNHDREQGNLPSAIRHWERAANLEPTNTLYARTLGYAYGEVARDRDQLQVFERLEHMDRSDPKIPSEIGYLHLRNGESRRAARAFRTALDRYDALGHNGTDARDGERDQFHLREEVNRLEDYFSLALYESFRTGQGRVGTAASTLAGGSIPSQGGVELSFQPPGIGLVNSRIFQIYTRLLWSNDPDSLTIDDATVQGGVGVRYKPLQAHNLFFSAEKLYRVGDNALSSWLLRSTYGWSDGADLTFDGLRRNYTYIFGDLGYVTGKADFVAFYGEAREGMTFQFWDRLLISPHVVMDGRVQSNDAARISYFEAGAGAAARLYFNYGHYEGYRANFELLVQYKLGVINVQDSVIVTGILRF